MCLDHNPIGVQGCRMLSKGKWPNLSLIELSHYLIILGQCDIGDEGCEYLSRGCWPKLSKIYICTFYAV